MVNRWSDKGTWVMWCKCHCFRVHPATHTRAQLDARQQFTAILRRLPANLDAMDLAKIYSNCNASSLGIPRAANSYKPKPWAYFSFRTEELKQAAMEMQFSLKGRDLVWDEPDNVRKFCARCGSDAHKAKDCDNSRGRSRVPKSLERNLARFKPEGY